MSFVWLMILALLPNIVAAEQASKKASKKAIILGNGFFMAIEKL